MARFEELLDEGKYQVFLMRCPATLPFSFAAHTWLIANRKGTTNWYTISWRRAREGEEVFGGHICHDCNQYLHKGDHGFGEGINIFPVANGPLWGARVVSYIEGSVGSLADRMSAFVEESFDTYPHANLYRLFGPNSNTYPAWILSHFSEADMRLPWNAIGKEHRA